jgi:glycosyltransferase involved in cell wall biosynthesis
MSSQPSISKLSPIAIDHSDAKFAGAQEIQSVTASGKHKSLPDLSLIIPIYNEVDSIHVLYGQLLSVLDTMRQTWELILIDDGSTDGSSEVLKTLSKNDKRIVLIKFVKNFGKTPAMNAGLDRARGKIIMFMDADLQNDPKDIPRLLGKLDEGYDVVSGRRQKRQDELFLRLIPSWFANILIAKVTGVHLRDYGCCLKAFRAQYIKNAKMYGEMHRFIPIYAAWQGARIAEIPVIHHARAYGYSKYGISRTFRVILDLITVAFMSNSMTAPIYVFGAFGLTSFCISMLLLAGSLIVPFLSGSTALHILFPVLAVLFGLASIQFVLMGLTAEVLIRTYYESQGKRIYITEEELNSTISKEEANEIIDCSV